MKSFLKTIKSEFKNYSFDNITEGKINVIIDDYFYEYGYHKSHYHYQDINSFKEKFVKDMSKDKHFNDEEEFDILTSIDVVNERNDGYCKIFFSITKENGEAVLYDKYYGEEYEY